MEARKQLEQVRKHVTKQVSLSEGELGKITGQIKEAPDRRLL